VGAFGDKFRKAREKKNISLDDASNVTKISARMLQAIEEERFDQLPGGVFNKGFIRAYAKHLGLNDEEAVTDYLACLRQAQIDAHEVWDPAPQAATRPAALSPSQPPAIYQKPTLKANAPIQVEEELADLQLPRAEDVRPPRRAYGGSSRQIPWSMVAVIVVVIALVILLWMRHGHTARTAAASSAPATPAITTPPAAGPAPDTNPPPAAKPATIAAAPTKSATNPAPKSTESSNPAPTKAASTPANAPTQAQATGARANQAASNDDANDVTVRTFPTTQPPAKPAPPMTLVIRASETSWISITADGQAVTHETLIAPAATTVRASREVVARIGNSAGVTFLWNGQEIPPQGTEAEVKTFIFDAQGMREVPNQPPAQNH
jgi:cytoskeletal protein RodZ